MCELNWDLKKSMWIEILNLFKLPSLERAQHKVLNQDAASELSEGRILN